MKILFITSNEMSSIDESGIYTDLLREFIKNGDQVTIISGNNELKDGKYNIENHIKYKKIIIKTGKINKVNIVKKAINLFLLNNQYKKAIKKINLRLDFDLIIYATPPITLNKVIRRIKTCSKSKTLLLLKDIFPQNAVDLEMFKNNGLIYKYYRKKEKDLYEISDFIGCMSQNNVDFLLSNNKFIDSKKVCIIPNSIEIRNLIIPDNKVELFKKYDIPLDKKIFLYGGNLGKPQGIDFLIKVIGENEKSSDNFILIIGSGVEYGKLNDYLSKNKIKNTMLLNHMPKKEFDNIVYHSDVGLILLDSRFTIPNIPSRMLSYMENKKPILAATDKYTDLRKMIEKGNFGYWCESKNELYFIELMNKFNDKKENSLMGKNSYAYLKHNFDINDSYNKIIELMEKKNV